MIKLPEKNYDPPRFRGRRKRHWGLILLVFLLVVGVTVGALIFYGDRDPAPVAESATPSLSPDQGLTSDPTPEPTPTPIPVPEIPDWIEEDLLPINEWSRPGEPMEAINGIAIHYVGNPGTTARQNRSYFGYLAQTHETSASSHFVVGMEGEIILCVPIGEIAYCTSFRNADTLSIEVCHPDKSGKFTQASYDSLVRLTRWLMDFYDLDVDDVLRHYDVTGKECPLYYVKHEDAWEAFKADLVSSQYAEENFEDELGVPD